MLWHNRIGRVSDALGCRFNAWHSRLRIHYCHSCDIGHTCSLDLTPRLGNPYTVGQPKKKNLTIELPYDPAILFLGIYPEKNIIRKDTCTPVFTAA